MIRQNKSVNQAVSTKHLFNIYLKIGKKRIFLSILFNIIMFIIIINLIMIVYTHRFESYRSYQESTSNWFHNNEVSVKSNLLRVGQLNIENDYINELLLDFSSLVNNLIPNLEFKNYTTAISNQLYRFDPSIPIEPWVNQELMAVDNRTYQIISKYIVDGRLPRNTSEVLCYRSPESIFSLNETIPLYCVTSSSGLRNYTIVGIIDNITTALQNEYISSDIFNWEFKNDYPFANYYKENIFLTNFSSFQEILNNFTYYYGTMTFLADFDLDCLALKLNKIINYIDSIPSEQDLYISPLLNREVEMLLDLKEFLNEFSAIWVNKIIIIFSINSPLLIIIGILFIITLNINSNELKTTFRKMQLYGLNYGIIRKLILFENLIFSMFSLILGSTFGIIISYLATMNIQERPYNFYNNFLIEPLTFIGILTLILGYFFISMILHNTIAKKVTRTITEEYEKKRSKFRGFFSTNEFKFIIIVLSFSIATLALFLLNNFFCANITFVKSFSYITILWFLMMCTIAFLLTFLFILLTRLIIIFWTFLANILWEKNLNIFSLTLKHLSVNKNNYQIAILGAIIFGLIITPSIAINISIQSHIENETNLQMGGSSLIINNWVDPNNELDGFLTNITEISNYTEVNCYYLYNPNTYLDYPKAFSINLLALENPALFSKIINLNNTNNKQYSSEDVLTLGEDSKILLYAKYARKYNLFPGDIFSSERFTRYTVNTSIINLFNYFPLMKIPKKGIFQNYLEVYSIIGSFTTIQKITKALDLDTEISGENYKLLKPVNDSVIPIIIDKLKEKNLIAKTYNDIRNEQFSLIQIFQKRNLRLFGGMAIFTLFVIGYYTGLKIMEERGKIIESLYRVGSVKRQLIGMFTTELLFINLLPMIIMILISLPLIKFISIFILGVQQDYFPYKAGIPFWIILSFLLAGLIIAILGAFIAILPTIYRFKPVKQE